MKEVVFVRHGQSEFNAWRFRQFYTPTQWFVRDPNIRDAELTQKGRVQAEAQRAEVAAIAQQAELFVCSPLTRAIQTMRIMFPDIRAPVIVTPLVREKMNYACDIGQPTSVLQARYPDYQFQHFDGEYWWKHRAEAPFEVFRESTAEVQERVAAFREFIHSRPENHIVVIAHGYFIMNTLGLTFMPGNCKTRRLTLP